VRDFIPTRAAGLEALTRFLPRAGRDYADQRNFDYGPDERSNISCLSPYLRYRLIAEAEVVDAVLSRHSFAAAEKFVQEVFWRTYWKGWLEQRPLVWDRYCDDLNRLLISTPVEYQRAIEGRTGIDCFDAWARELKEFGYLHNHARMWFASIWIFTLRLPWQLGAKFFYDHLLDADPASNTLSWRWIAGLQTVGKAYLARADNISHYSNGRFQPVGLASIATPFTEVPIDPPQDFARAGTIPQEPFGLLITPEDLNPESLIDISSRMTALATAASALTQAAPVNGFITEALTDAAMRASEHFATPCQPLLGLDPDSVIQWAEENSLKTIVTAYPPIGPTRTQIDRLRPALGDKGVTLTLVQRQWDSQAWPHARKGFFPFREKIPKLIR
jgi:deoxyribodipyrimidine photo-lyase